MLHNYIYKIGEPYQLIDTLTEARKLQRGIISSNKTACLYSDGKGFYIRKIYTNGKEKRVY